MAVLINHADGIVRDAPPVQTHNEYPKMMSHPAFQPASVGTEVTSPAGFKHHVGGTPVRFPPVLVKNEDDEEYYAAKGYVSQGKSDPAAFARAVATAAPVNTGYVPQRYPMWAGGVLVNNAEEEAAALAARQVQLGIEPSEPAAEVKKPDEAGTVASSPPVPPDDEKTADQIRIEALEAQLAEMRAMMAKLTGAPVQAVQQDAAPEAPVTIQAEGTKLQAGDTVTIEGTPHVVAAPAQSTMTKGQRAWATRQARAAARQAAGQDAA
jgi:hypothetical protein